MAEVFRSTQGLFQSICGVAIETTRVPGIFIILIASGRDPVIQNEGPSIQVKVENFLARIWNGY
jgi:hypothetical protein